MLRWQPTKEAATLTAANGSKLTIKGIVELDFKILGRNTTRNVTIIDGLGTHQFIIGIDMIKEMQMTITGNKCLLPHHLDKELVSLHPRKRFIIPPRTIMHKKVYVRGIDDQVKPGRLCLISATYATPYAWEGIQTIQPDGGVVAVFANTSDNHILVRKRVPIAHIEMLEDQNPKPATEKDVIAAVSSFMGKIRPDPPSPSSASAAPLNEKEKEEFLDKLQLKCPDEWKSKYTALCLRFHDVFSKSKFDLGRCNTIEHSIRLKDTDPVHKKQFQLPYSDAETAADWVEELLKQGAIEVSRSAYNSPLFFVAKQDKTRRAVLDFRALNTASIPDKYIIREIRACIDEVGAKGSKVFSAIDLTSGFWQQTLEKQSRQYTAFTVPGGARYQWCVTPMGLQGSPASFSRLMDHVVSGLKDVIAYIDDVLAHSANHEQHLACLERVFLRFRQFNLKMQPKKSILGAKELQYLGYLLTEHGVGPGLEKLKAIQNFNIPESTKKIREFLGMANYFRFMVPNFAKHAAHLSKLLTKEAGYKKGSIPDTAKQAFVHLRDALARGPIVQHPTRTGEWHLTTDASQGDKEHPGGLGAVLSQFVDGKERVIAYASRGLKKFEKNYSAYLLELAAAEWAIDHFYVYLKGRHFKLWTDHKPLTALSTVHKKTLNRLQQLRSGTRREKPTWWRTLSPATP
jgi:hypothetical protein